MNFDNDITDVFDRYLAGQMSEGEKAEFLQQLQADAALNEAFEFHRDIVAGIRESRREEMKDYIKKNAKITYIGNVWGRNWVYASAAIITICIAAYFILANVGQKTSEKIAEVNETIDSNQVAKKDNTATDVQSVEDTLLKEGQKEKQIIHSPDYNGAVAENVPPPPGSLPQAVGTIKTAQVYEASTRIQDDQRKAAFRTHATIEIEYQPGDKLQYTYTASKVILYNARYEENVALYKLDNKTLLQYSKAYYVLQGDGKIHDLKPTDDSSLLKKLPAIK